MIPSRKSYQYKIIQFILTDDDNPSKWTKENLTTKLNNEVIIGYLFKRIIINTNVSTLALNLYTMKEDFLQTKNKIINIEQLKIAYKEWLENLITDIQCKKFKNPPIKEWMDTKDNWVKKLANSMSKKYNQPYDECLSAVNYSIMKCFSKSHVYIGNLSYIEKTVDNDIKMNYRYLKNRITLSNPKVDSMDETINDDYIENGGVPLTLHDIIGKVDPQYEEQDYEDLKAEIIKDLKTVFSDREIDQIINMPNLITLSIYRKLLKWRVKHHKEDYIHE